MRICVSMALVTSVMAPTSGLADPLGSSCGSPGMVTLEGMPGMAAGMAFAAALMPCAMPCAIWPSEPSSV